MTEPTVEYALATHVDLPYEEAVEKVTACLKDQGFGVLTEIDVKATLKEKLDVDFRRYIILGACNPPFAHQALTTEIEIGLMLPCNVIVYEDDDRTAVLIADPEAMMQFSGNPALTPIAKEVRGRLEKVLAAVQA